MIITSKDGTKRIRIEHDDDACNNPRDRDNLGTIATWHRRYNLGDEQPRESMEEWWERITGWGEDDAETVVEKFNRLYISLPVYMYDHSGITINTTGFSCPWDSGQIGLIYVSRRMLEYEKLTEDQALEYLRGEIEVYDQYLRGDIYYFVEEEYDEETGEWVEVNLCGGFYGDGWETNGMTDYCPWLREGGGVWPESGI